MTSIEAIDARIAATSGRSKRQLQGGRKWLLAGGRGSVEWATGTGKTRIAIELSKILRRDEKHRSICVIVPTVQLKQQWEKGLLENGLGENSIVEVINTTVKRKVPLEIDMLILDRFCPIKTYLIAGNSLES